MDAETRSALRELNRGFYEERAAAFSETRDHPWPGWKRVVARAREAADATRRAGDPARALRVLDVGCGNGRLAGALLDARLAELRYLGLDASAEMLALARADHPGCEFRLCDVLDLVTPPGALAAHLAGDAPFDLVAAFGLFHHVPGFAQRRALLAALLGCARAGGLAAASFWQFGSFARLRARIAPWSELDPAIASRIDGSTLEAGDHLLRFGEGSGPLRYCHFIDEPELDRLLDGLPATVVDRFASDGREDALNAYVVLRAT